MHLSDFGSDLTVAVIGATGGVGGALLDRLNMDPDVSHILAFSRHPQIPDSDSVSWLPLDLTDEQSIEEAARCARESSPLDLVIVASGLLHSTTIKPEKSMRSTDAESMRTVFDVNTIGPALIAAAFLPLMRRNRKSVFAALSARVGSIGDNRLGGWVSYRASKAALNMVLRTFAIEQARRNPECVVVGLHPGTVASALSRPFTSRNAPRQLFQPDEAAANLLSVVSSLSPADTGGVFAWDGTRIEY